MHATLHLDRFADSPRTAPLRRLRRFAGRLGRAGRAAALAGSERRAMTFIFLLALGGVAANVAEPLLLKRLFDGLGSGGEIGRIVRLGVALLALELGRQSATVLSNWLTWRARLRVHHRLLEATVSRLHQLPASHLQRDGVGAVMIRLDRGIQGFLGAFQEVSFNVLPSLAYLSFSIAVMMRLEPRLALVALAFAPGPALIALLAAPEQVRRERTLLDRWAKIYSRFREVLSGIVTVRSFAREEYEKERFLKDVAGANGVVEHGVGRDGVVGATQSLVAALGRIGVIGIGSWLVLRGEITVGTVVAFLGYTGGLFGPVRGLTGLYGTVCRASASLDVILSILDAPDPVPDAPGARELAEIRGEVAFRGVRFRYGPDQRWVLDGIELSVAAGEMIALVGPSGTGKTTLISLLQRHYDPVEGSILLDGLDLREIQQRSFRRQLGVVLQDALLFNDTVRNNIAYGRPDAPLSAIEEAARAANAHDFITRLPEGYETLVGEQGGRLSAGERQRIAIARVLLKDPRILILDEATSALDAESEALVQEALARLIRGRTAFVIAHRLSTVVNADRILVLRDGRIVEAGRHAELMEADGYYASLVRRQIPMPVSA